MSHRKYLLIISFFVLCIPFVLAVPTLNLPVNGDVNFPNAVLIPNPKLPSDLSVQTGSSSVKIEGTGSVTIWSQSGGGFPQVQVLGGTTITSTRVWSSETLRKTWWEGQFETPRVARFPENIKLVFSVPGNHEESKVDIIAAYGWGLPNETFSYSTPANVSFFVDEKDGTKLLVAYEQNNGTWKIEEIESCVVLNQVCSLELKKVNTIALVKEIFTTCPQNTVMIPHSHLSGPPECRAICDKGYQMNIDGTKCLIIPEDELMEEDFHNSSEDILGQEQKRGSSWTKGFVRYRPSHDQLTYENGRRSKDINKNKIFQTEEIIANTDNDAAMNYSLMMREKFGANSSPNDFSEKKEGDNLIASNKEDITALHGSAPLLPSTGPEIFVGIAALGIVMMILGVRRQ